MKRDVIFITVDSLYIPSQNDTLLVAIDTEGRVWTKLMFGQDEWHKQPTPVETVH